MLGGQSQGLQVLHRRSALQRFTQGRGGSLWDDAKIHLAAPSALSLLGRLKIVFLVLVMPVFRAAHYKRSIALQKVTAISFKYHHKNNWEYQAKLIENINSGHKHHFLKFEIKFAPSHCVSRLRPPAQCKDRRSQGNEVGKSYVEIEGGHRPHD